ncbi:hypothetical protein [Streptomyces brasiliensis]|uniref:Uncharacterized protein n=1 Tax=Streptomyces brasiliensis TaxID=1954 RepID=A0A917P4H9_9ACTN|nr:hypothetical protein [Streptomyces brasiliensis]GGJ61325.1 hypothetical protein GCM10010121_084860 [Streptomyces brasiliensis]
MTNVVGGAEAPALRRVFCLARREKILPPAGGVPTASLPSVYAPSGMSRGTHHDNAGVIL